VNDRAATAGLRLRAPAKINLYLRVVGRRDDGYHLIDSMIAFADVGDTVAASVSNSIDLAVDGPFARSLGEGPDNLVLQAAHALSREAPRRPGAALRLTKNLPVASGIGGGSADAAATLRLLSRLWRLDIAPRRLAEIALSLGADVPACLDGRTLRAGGIGDVIEPAPPLPPIAVVLVNNGEAVETAAVFAARARSYAPPAPPLDRLGDVASLARLCGALGNDLAEAAARIEPSIPDVLAALGATNGCRLAQLSGSGATCFGLFETPAGADAAARRLSKSHPGWWVRPARFLNAPPALEPLGSNDA
jgi:4-diphosphocytidyl-2-C-methyl-D-erythritol kinase